MTEPHKLPYEKIVLVAAFNRPKSLHRLVSSLVRCSGFDSYALVITYHLEIPEVSNYLLDLKLDNLILLPVCGLFRSAIENININRILGYKYCFEILEAQLVVALEDDVEVAYDALALSEFILNKYGDNPRFRCVNLGSRQPFDEKLKFSYGKFRYGLFGQGSCIGRRQYFQQKANSLHRWDLGIGLDGMLENYYKTGFVIMPYSSRYINDGRGGTHAPEDQNDKYYCDLKSSFVGLARFFPNRYEENISAFEWRSDCIHYKKSDDIPAYFMFLIFKIRIATFTRLKRRLRKYGFWIW